MSTTTTTLPRKITAALMAAAIVVGSAALFLDRADAGSTVTPNSGPQGKSVVGTYKGQTKNLVTMLFEVQLNGQESFMFCIDIATSIEFGVTYDEQAWSDSNVTNLPKITRVLSQTSATSSKDPVEIAAVQAAIWHFSDGFDLAVADPKNDPAVVARYQQLVADADANPVDKEPAGSLSVAPDTQNGSVGQPLFYDIATTATAPLTLEVSDSAVLIHPATGDTCDTSQVIATATGNSRICLTTTDPRKNVKLTVRTASAQVSAGRVFIRPNRQKLIIGRDGTAQAVDVATANWSANGAPTVKVECPAGGVTFGQPATFTATATDPENGPLLYLWTVNGTPVSGATTNTLTATLRRSDVLKVTVKDSGAATASATADCAGNNPPTVSLSCPDKLILGGLDEFTAVGTDPDGDGLTYQWTLNGSPLSQTGATISVQVTLGDVLSVVAVDETGMSSAVATADCLQPNQPPTVTLTCPTNLVYGQPATFAAQGADPEGASLTYRWYVDGQLQANRNGASAQLTVNEGQKVSVEAVDQGGKASAKIDSTCNGERPNRPPTVKVSCPTELIWGRTTTFTATGTDPDGDSLTYEWSLNDQVIAGQTAGSVSTALAEGDRLSVIVRDSRNAASAAVRADCPGRPDNRPPTVSLTCPKGLLYGRPAVFTATGEDPDGDAVTFKWFIDDELVAGANGPSVELTVNQGQRVTVVSNDGVLDSAEVTKRCPGEQPNRPPVVSLECPVNLVFGEPGRWIANAADPDGDLDLIFSWYVNDRPVAGATGPSAQLSVGPTDKVTVTATDSKNLVSAPATTNCSGNSRPTVELQCPPNLEFGQPATFTATGNDPDGDPLTFVWRIDDEIVTDQSGATAGLTITKGQTVSVSVIDDQQLSSSAATSTCAGNTRPKVTTVCPKPLVIGEAAIFEATGTDADGDSLTYAWSVNGQVVEGQTGPKATLTPKAGDKVSVVAKDTTGLASAGAPFDCLPLPRPTITVSCPANFVAGQAATFTAVGSVSDNTSLAYTWAVNNQIVAGQSGPTASLTVSATDRVSVNALSTNGLVSSTVAVTCTSPPPASVSNETLTTVPAPIPATPNVLGTRVFQAAIPAVSGLAYTGSSTSLLATLAGLFVLAGGLVLLVTRKRIMPSPTIE